MFELLSHFICLFIESLNLHFSRSNISLQLFDFVIKHKFEFFKLLSFLFKINNTFIFIFDSFFSFLKLIILTFLLLLKLVNHFGRAIQILLFWGNFLLFLLLFILLFLIVIMNQSQVALGLHTLIYDDCKFLLVFVFENINSVPRLIFNLLSFSLVILYHQLNFFFQPISFLTLSVKLNFLVLFKLFDNFLVVETEFI